MTEPYYQDDLVTLYHGDCREITAWLEADVLVTDPPYGRAWRQGDVRRSDSRLVQARNAASETGIANDQDTSVRDTALAAWGTHRRGIVFGDLMLAPPSGNKLTCVYYKTDRAAGLRGAMGGVRRDAEAIYLIGPWPTGIGGRSSVFASRQRLTSGTGVVAANGGHPHTKPNEVMEELLLLAEGVVADPFAGSGSTLIAAKSLGRPAIGVEDEERYCEIAAKRLAQDTLFGGVA
jgi:predicted RNA methylase